MPIDLFLDDTPVRERSTALFGQLREMIMSGRLGPGDQLPTTRALADDLGLARSTVAGVYGRLVAEGYADGRVGAGTFVSSRPHVERTRRVSATRVGRGAPSRGLRDRDPVSTPVADLRAGRPDPSLFPVTDWRRSATGMLHLPPPGYGDEAGSPELRDAVAAWVRRSRGVDAAADHVVVTAGAQGAFVLCSRVLIGHGDVVAVEDPGYRPARVAFHDRGARIAPVPVDRDGIVVSRIPADAKVILVTPSHQSPTGAVLSLERRRQLLDLAQRQNAIVIEDDYDTELRYVDRPLEPLHRMDRSGRTVYVGTFSKTISPALRLGFLVAPPDLVDAVVEARLGVDIQPPHLTQAALLALLTSGSFDRHLRRIRRVYRRRRDLVVEHLERLVADGLVADFAPCAAGMHTTLSLLPSVDADVLAALLATRGVAIDSTTSDQMRRRRADLVVGFGLADELALATGLAVLREAVASF